MADGRDNGYTAVMSRSNEIMKRAVGIDYNKYKKGPIVFDYEEMLHDVGYSIEQVKEIQRHAHVGDTPLIELHNITRLVRAVSPPGKGARILVKDEAANPSGSFKDRRASLSIHQAKKFGYPGVVVATSGNYGAAVASQAAMAGLNCIVIQELYDSRGVGQPEILEKGRKCEAFGAEVIQLTVGPELFYVVLRVLEETGYFNASLYSPYSIVGIETLGYEIGREVIERFNRPPDAVVITHAGGGNVTGTARGLFKCGCVKTRIIGASVDLTGLHMASDRDFNRKSFTTGHTGFGVPFATQPDRADVPINAARPLRYLDRYVTISQGEVFYVTEMLAQLEGMERGPAGNTSLAAAFALAREMDRDQIVVVQETEYTGAGKHPTAQLTFARQNGVEVRRGDPRENVPGKCIVIPEHPAQIAVRDVPLDKLRRSYLSNTVKRAAASVVDREELAFLSAETKMSTEAVRACLEELGISINEQGR